MRRINAEAIAMKDDKVIYETLEYAEEEKGIGVCMSSNGFEQTCLELRDGFSTHIYLTCNFSKSQRTFLLPS